MSTEAFRAVGRTLGRYRILDGLALGGMAEIYLARVMGSTPPEYVVVKQIQPHLAEDPAFVQLFLNEAELAAKLEHEHIGRVYDRGESDGLYYFAMEYLHGYDARALFESAQRKKLRIPLQHALCIVAKVADALQYAHDKRDAQGKPLAIVHRDVSPSNIFVTYDGRVKLVDFGLARVADDSQKLRPTTIKGKAAYLSPEQCAGEPLDRLSDIFSLGVVLYELTTGTRLFRRQDNDTHATIMNRVMKGEVPLPSSVVDDYPSTLQEVVLQALDVDPRKRHPTARALMLDMEAVARTEGLTLSTSELAGYLEQMFGRRSEPWLDLPDDDEDDEPSSAGDDEFDQPVAEDEFDDDGATSLYTGNVEDIHDAWTAEALAVGTRASVTNMSTRASSMRLALPLKAEDSDEFENPLLEVEDSDEPRASSPAHVASAARRASETEAPSAAPDAAGALPSGPGLRQPSHSDIPPVSQTPLPVPPAHDESLAPAMIQAGAFPFGQRLPTEPPATQDNRMTWLVLLAIVLLLGTLTVWLFLAP